MEEKDEHPETEVLLQKQEENIFLDRKDCCYDRTILNIILILGIVAGLLLYFQFHFDKYINIGTGVFIVCYIVEVFLSNTFSFILHSMKYTDAYQKIELLSRTNPRIQWSIQCYHYETRHRTVRRRNKNGSSSSHTETYQVRVNTHHATELVPYSACADVSTMMECLKHLPLLQYCRLYIEKHYDFADSQSKINFNSMKSRFITVNKRDTHYSFSESFDIDGFMSRICTFGSNDDSMPCMYKMGTYLIFSLIGFGWIIRILLYKNSFAANAKIIKRLSI